MRLYFGGSEVPSHRKLLTEANVEYVSLSYVGLRRKVKFARPWLIEEHYTPQQHVFLDSGCYSLNKAGSKITEEEAAHLATGYMAFAKSSLDRVDMVSEFDAKILGNDWLQAMREEFYDGLGEKFLPIWHSDTGLDELTALAQKYRRVGILQTEVNSDLTAPLTRLVSEYGTRLHGVAMTKMSAMQEIPWDSVGSTSWISPQQWGDTFVWTGRELKRYPKAYKESSRKRHRMVFQDNGFDVNKIQADDTTEVLKLSIWSWTQFVAHISEKDTVIPASDEPVEVDLDVEDTGTNLETPSDDVTHQLDKRGTPRGEMEPYVPRQTIPIPVMGISRKQITGTDAAGNEYTDYKDVFVPRSESLRMCDGCYIKDKCMGFKKGANCLYNIPIMVETIDDVKNIMNAVISFQTQRVLNMQMIEQVEGGYADANLSSEIDRLARLIKQSREVFVGGNLAISGDEKAVTGFISGLLGTEEGKRARALPAPLSADSMLVDLDITAVDAEVVDE